MKQSLHYCVIAYNHWSYINYQQGGHVGLSQKKVTILKKKKEEKLRENGYLVYF